MFSFLLGLGAGAFCVLNPAGTRRLLATLIVKGQDTVTAVSTEAAMWSKRVGEELGDITAEARAEREKAN